MEKLRLKLLEFGNPVVLKEGFVFTVLITGQNLSKWKNVEEIQRMIIEYAAEKYPLIEVLVNDDSFFCMVLKPKQQQFTIQANAVYAGSAVPCPYRVGNECMSRTVAGCFDETCDLNARPKPILTAVCATCLHNPCQCQTPINLIDGSKITFKNQ